MLRNALRPVFSLCAAFRGTLIIKRRANSLFPHEPQVCGKWGARAQKRGFACASIYFQLSIYLHPYVHKGKKGKSVVLPFSAVDGAAGSLFSPRAAWRAGADC